MRLHGLQRSKPSIEKEKGQGKVNVVPTSSSVATQFQLPGSQ
jgi:hypothetical protein